MKTIINDKNDLLEKANLKLKPLRDKNLEILSKLQRLNLEFQNLEGEEKRIKADKERLIKSQSTLAEDIEREKNIILEAQSNEKRLNFSFMKGPKNVVIFNNIFEKLIINEKIDKTLFSLMCASQFTRLLPFRIKSKDFHNAKYFYSLASHILK